MIYTRISISILLLNSVWYVFLLARRITADVNNTDRKKKEIIIERHDET